MNENKENIENNDESRLRASAHVELLEDVEEVLEEEVLVSEIHSHRCRPVCKSRRREWKGQEQITSAELLLERKPIAECFRRWPTKVYPNSPCPLFGRTKRVTVKERNKYNTHDVVRICQAPVDDKVDTPYLRYADMAKKLGAWGAVNVCCAFCECGACCPCRRCDYEPRDADRAAKTRTDMRQYDARVKTCYQEMKIMYDKS